MFRVLSSVKTYIKCRLPSSLFFSDSRLLFNESLTAKALWTLQEYVRSWILCVPRTLWWVKLISLIRFDIFNQTRSVCQSNLLSELVLSSGTPIQAFWYHFYWRMSKRSSISVFLPWRARRSTFNARHTFACVHRDMKHAGSLEGTKDAQGA